MPVIKYIAVHKSPLRLLRYMTKAGKTKNTLVRGMFCSSDVDTAYQEMKNIFEYYSGERFHKKSLELKPDNQKESIRLHHYIQSFAPGEVSAAEAHEIAMEWARRVFGNRPVFISTHIDKGHIHNHFAVCPYDCRGNHWHGNKETLKKCRAVSDSIAKLHGLSVIEKPKRNANRSYGENLARRKKCSWKQKLCDDIDEIISMPEVKSIDDLVSELKKKGYITRFGKYLSVRPPEAENAVRTYRLGDGYALEHLKYRIEHKETEMPLSEVMKYDGVQRELVMCIRQIQIEINRKPEKDRLRLATYREVLKSVELLGFVTDNDIHSVSGFEKKVSETGEKVNELLAKKQKILDEISEQEKHIAEIPKYLELKNKRPLLSDDIEELKKYRLLKLAGVKTAEDEKIFRDKIAELQKPLAELGERIAGARAEHKAFSDCFDTYTENMKSDYQVMLERTKAEIEAEKTAEERIRQKKEEAEIRKQQEEYYSGTYYISDDDAR